MADVGVSLFVEDDTPDPLVADLMAALARWREEERACDNEPPFSDEFERLAFARYEATVALAAAYDAFIASEEA